MKLMFILLISLYIVTMASSRYVSDPYSSEEYEYNYQSDHNDCDDKGDGYDSNHDCDEDYQSYLSSHGYDRQHRISQVQHPQGSGITTSKPTQITDRPTAKYPIIDLSNRG